ncbi:Cof-type HAD-IIB family hydrolase [Anaerocolumna sedimenticola]|uniref:Cof-type HAD-IIB family hydrolase n=1 Tax=Anaerocolumna sedimenticola TaxID=2696063 RepID=A0A6P1TSI2_9FIRM|nr:Cof-type HAD-IIB family hydrolase [Anaerocolumna sedimenticola]QHQ63307.1 Cof-type HAD-IIB family hydrolase [Anaerocolumna sedimenticola]
MIKWIVLDMDGTLLNEIDQITERTRSCLIRCQERGIRIILASGRSYPRLLPYAQQLQMKEHNGYLIEVNGMATYYLATEERQVIRQLQEEDIRTLFAFGQSMEVEVQCYEDQAIYYWIPEWQRIEKEKERTLRGLPKDYPNLGGAWTWITDITNGYPLQKQIQSVEEVPKKLNKINCAADPKTNQRVYNSLKEQYGEDYEIVRSCPRLIEISPKGITKGQTLKYFMNKFDIKYDEVLVFGDGENDVDMFRQIKYSVAMDNAEEFIKVQAYTVTKSNKEEGVALILEKLLDKMETVE